MQYNHEQTYLLSPAPHPIQCLGEVTKILCLECKVLQGLCCFAANLFYCLRLPCQYNARGRWPKYYAWNVRSCGVDAASQQTYFIISGSPSNTMLGGGEQNTILWMYSRVVSSVGRLLLRSKPIILSPAFLMANGCGMIIYLCLSIAYLTTLNSSIANWTFGCIAIWTFRCIAIWYPKSIAWWLFPYWVSNQTWEEVWGDNK